MADKLLNLKKKRGQGLLETTLAIILVVLFLGGILQIWLWSNKQIVKRQREYNNTRVDAGKSSDTYQRQWPVYTPEELPEGQVLKGPY